MTRSRWLSLSIIGSIVGCGFLTLNVTTSEADAARVVCISADEDSFTTGAEGYYRSLAPKQAGKPDDIRVGGSLEDCMAKADNGDQLVIVAHGTLGAFSWRSVPPTCCLSVPTVYTGFGAGTGNGPPNPHPVPDNLRHGLGIKVTFVGCDSDNDPDNEGPRKSVAESLRNSLSMCSACTVTGYQTKVNSRIAYAVGNAANGAQRTAAEQNLTMKGGWCNNPPVNRPNSPVNHKTAAEAQLNAKPAFMGAGLTVAVSYLEPQEKSALATSVAGDSFCGGVDTVPVAEVPGIGGLGLLIAFLLMIASGAMVVWRLRIPSRQPRG